MDEYFSQSDIGGQRPPMSDAVGQGRIMADNDRQRPTLSEQSREKHTLTTVEALKIFESNGLPRSQRSLERYCKAGKLDCFTDPDEQRYYITKESVERLIGHLKELAARHGVSVSGVVGQVPPVADNGGHGRTMAEEQRQPPVLNDEETERRIRELEREKKELERENLDLKITNKAKEYVIEQYQKERTTFIDRISDSMQKIGELKTKLLQLGAPKEEVEERRVDTTEDYTKF